MLASWWLGAFAGPRRLAGWLGESAVAAQPSASFESFLDVSSTLTGFPKGDLDRAAGKIFWDRLSRREKALALKQTPRDLQARILEFWFTGAIGKGGDRIIAMTSSTLAWKCVRYTTPPMTCRSGWWDRPQ